MYHNTPSTTLSSPHPHIYFMAMVLSIQCLTMWDDKAIPLISIILFTSSGKASKPTCFSTTILLCLYGCTWGSGNKILLYHMCNDPHHAFKDIKQTRLPFHYQLSDKSKPSNFGLNKGQPCALVHQETRMSDAGLLLPYGEQIQTCVIQWAHSVCHC